MVDILETISSREGHFLLESGYHTNLWFTLDGSSTQPTFIGPFVIELAEKLRKHEPTAVAGPLLGGAFLG